MNYQFKIDYNYDNEDVIYKAIYAEVSAENDVVQLKSLKHQSERLIKRMCDALGVKTEIKDDIPLGIIEITSSGYQVIK